MLSGSNLLLCSALTCLAIAVSPAVSPARAEDAKTALFKVITVKDDIVIGLSADELTAIGGSDASAVAHALAQKGDLTAWQYNVHRGATGELLMTPTAKVGLLANASLRVEPFSTSYAVVPHP